MKPYFKTLPPHSKAKRHYYQPESSIGDITCLACFTCYDLDPLPKDGDEYNCPKRDCECPVKYEADRQYARPLIDRREIIKRSIKYMMSVDPTYRPPEISKDILREIQDEEKGQLSLF